METALIEQMGFIMGDWIPKEASIAVAQGDQYIYCKAGIYDLQIRTGEKVSKGSVADLTYEEGKRIEKVVENTSFGSSYYGIGYPIDLDGRKAVVVIILPADYIVRKKQPLAFLTGKLEDTWRPVQTGKVSHIESSQKKTWFFAEEEMYCSIHTLKNLKHQLPDSFLPIHRSYIVNINYIEEISRDISSNYVLTMQDGAILPISQNYTAAVRERLGF